MKQAVNPESGTINYGYDNNGNLTSKTDARNITTIYTYAALNRVQQRSYNDNPQTPTVTYFYDNLTNARGKLMKVSSSVSMTEYTGFDIMGRVTLHKQTTDGQAYTTGYTYNLAGGLVEETYPSGRVVRNVLDGNGELSMVESKKNANAGFWRYAGSISYAPSGAVTSLQLGNGHWESTTFNARLQPTQIALGILPGQTNLLKLDYSYGDWVSGQIDATRNNLMARSMRRTTEVRSDSGTRPRNIRVCVRGNETKVVGGNCSGTFRNSCEEFRISFALSG